MPANAAHYDEVGGQQFTRLNLTGLVGAIGKTELLLGQDRLSLTSIEDFKITALGDLCIQIIDY